MQRRQFLGAAAAATAMTLSTPLRAQEAPIVLDVTGRVEATRSFTLEQLQSLGVAALTTSTPWTEGVPLFEGVRASDVMAAVGPVASDSVVAVALNDYRAEIPLTDFTKFDVLFAWSMNGRMLSRRDKGPLWIVYPRDAVPELAEERYESRWVWQLCRLILP